MSKSRWIFIAVLALVVVQALLAAAGVGGHTGFYDGS